MPTPGSGEVADGRCKAMTPQEVQERLKLSQLKDKIWYVVPSCATTGEGLFEGLVSTGCSGGRWRDTDVGAGLAVEQRQDAPATTVQMTVSGTPLRILHHSTSYSTCTTAFL